MTNNADVIMDCEFFPCWEWFNTFYNANEVLLEQHEYFVRTSYRNRAYVTGPNGVICLTVPLQGGRNQRTIMKDIKVCNDEDWQALHWKTLEACYRRSVYFEYFEDILRLFYHQKFEYLLDVNLSSLNIILDLLQIKKAYSLTEGFEKNIANDFRSAFLPKNRKVTSQPAYVQPFSDRVGFEPNLSMLDYLFCCGRWE
jgi:hypothetical protein